jgi:ubiquitin carboxyl-terminal hydrolase 10
VTHQAAADSKIVRPETPATSLPASDDNASTNPTTPSSTQQHAQAPGDATPVAQKPVQRPTAPVIPALPALPRAVPRDAPKATPEKIVTAPVETAVPASSGNGEVHIIVPTTEENNEEEGKETAPAAKAWTTPKLWAGLFNPNAPISTASSESGQGAVVAGGGKSNSESLAEALRSFNAVSSETKVAFLEPRGLVNTGNMCYMNSVSGCCCRFDFGLMII